LGVSSVATVLAIALGLGGYFTIQLDRAKRNAESERTAAQTARTTAERLKSEADRQRAEVEKQKNEVETQQGLLETERKRTRRILYAAEINRADRAWREHDASRALATLSRQDPHYVDLHAAGDEDLRSWEWYFLRSMLDTQQRRLPIHVQDGVYYLQSVVSQGIAASLTGQGSLSIWKLETGEELFLLPKQEFGADAFFRDFTLSPDGESLVFSLSDGCLLDWDWRNGRQRHELQGAVGVLGAANALRFSADGQLVAACDSDKNLRLWDRSGKLVHEWKLPDWASDVAFHPEGKILATCGGSPQNIQLWNISDQSLVGELSGHTGIVFRLVWTANGTRLASGSYDDTIRIWDTATKKELHQLRGHRGPVGDLQFRADGKELLSGGNDGTLRFWNTETGAPGRILTGHSQEVTGCTYLADPRHVLSVANDQSVRIWNAEHHGEFITGSGHTGRLNLVGFNRDGSKLFTAGDDGVVMIRDGHTGGGRMLRGQPQGGIVAGEWHPDGERLVYGLGDGIEVWNTRTGETTTIAAGQRSVQSLAVSPDGRWIATGGYDSTVKLWDVQTGELVRTHDSHENYVWAVAFSPDSSRLAAGGHDHRLFVWDRETGEQFMTREIWNFPTGMQFLPAGDGIVTPLGIGLEFFALPDGKTFRRFLGHTGGCNAIALTPDGKRLVTGSQDRTVKLWDLETEQEVLTLPCPVPVRAVAVSPDGTRIAAVGDTTLLIWSAPVPH
jgi:WD40 repeat protein